MGLDLTGLGAVADAATTIANKFWPDKTEIEKAAMAAQLQEVMNSYNLANAQIEVNKVEAASTNWFVAGPRPFILWICGVSLGYQFLFFPLFSKYFNIIAIDGNQLQTILFGLLGLGAMRTAEKLKNAAGNH